MVYTEVSSFHCARLTCNCRPGMREEMCWRPDVYLTDHHLQHATKYHQILWPHELEDCYEISPVTQRYQFTPAFRLCMRDLRCWTLEQRFFDDYPDLRKDCPSYEVSLLTEVADKRTRTVQWIAREQNRAKALRRDRTNALVTAGQDEIFNTEASRTATSYESQ